MNRSNAAVAAAVMAAAVSCAGAEDVKVDFDGKGAVAIDFSGAAGSASLRKMLAKEGGGLSVPEVPAVVKDASPRIRFETREAFDGANPISRLDPDTYEMVACSEKGKTWQSHEQESRTVKKERQDIYVCVFDVTWEYRWSNCSETNPHTAPGQCSCRQLRNQRAAVNIGQCEWQQADGN